jgi:hypothetical protein
VATVLQVYGATPYKEYLEPDFIIRLPGDSCKIVELEKPGKRMATKQGQPRAEVGQGAFQLAEFRDYILNHYDQIKEEFPGINIRSTSMLVISRATEESVGKGREVRRYMDLVAQQYRVGEVFLYDDLVNRAKQAYTQLVALLPTSDKFGPSGT